MTMGAALLPVGTHYTEVYARFRWQLPTNFNIGVDVCDRHADDPSRLAMIYEDDTSQVSTHTFAEFRARSNQLAHVLSRLGIARGDRVSIILSQRPETAVAHLAAYKLGAIALPLSTLFGPEALDYRLRDAEAQVVMTDAESLDRVLGMRDAFLHYGISSVLTEPMPRASLTTNASSPTRLMLLLQGPCMRTRSCSGICQRSSFI